MYESLREGCDGDGVAPQGILFESHNGHFFHVKMPGHRRVGNFFDSIRKHSQREQKQQKQSKSLHHQFMYWFYVDFGIRTTPCCFLPSIMIFNGCPKRTCRTYSVSSTAGIASSTSFWKVPDPVKVLMVK